MPVSNSQGRSRHKGEVKMPKPKTIRRQRESFEIALVLILVILISLVSWKFYKRFDITKDKAYSLSQSTVKIIRDIKGRLNAELFLSRDLPASAQPLSERIKDILAEYEASSGGSFRYRLIDPTNNPEMQKRAENLGIPEVQMQAIAKDQLQVVKVYLGLALIYEDKKEVIPVLENPGNFEYDITSRILKLTREELPTIAVADFSRRFSFSEQAPESRFTQLKDLLRERFTIKDVELETKLEIPSEAKTLIVLNPMGLSEEAKYVIDQFLMKGGSLIAPMDAAMMPSQGLQAYPALPGIETMIEKFGVSLKKQLVLDLSNAIASFSAGAFVLSLPYPMWVKILPDKFNKTLPPTASLESLVLPWTGYLELADDRPAGITYEPLFKTTDKAWTIKSPFDLNPQQDFRTSRLNAEIGQYTLGYIIRGKLPSAFKKDGPPKIPEDAEEDRKTLLSRVLDPKNFIKDGTSEATVIAIACGRFLEDGYVRQFPENALFLENLADWLSQGEALIGIRSRGLTSNPIRVNLTEPAKNLIKYGNIIGVPALLIFFGILRWMMRLKKRIAIKHKYLPATGGET